jgi:hypothetical protein
MVGSMLGSVGHSIHHVDRLAQKDVAVRVKRHAVPRVPNLRGDVRDRFAARDLDADVAVPE